MKVLVISIKDFLKAVCICEIISYIFIKYVQLDEYIYFQLLAVTVVIKKITGCKRQLKTGKNGKDSNGENKYNKE